MWLATCVVGYMCGWLHVWLATCVVGYMCGRLSVWLATCVVVYMCGWLHVWSATGAVKRTPTTHNSLLACVYSLQFLLTFEFSHELSLMKSPHLFLGEIVVLVVLSEQELRGTEEIEQFPCCEMDRVPFGE